MPVKGHAALANPRSRGKDSRLVINSSYDPKEMEHEEEKKEKALVWCCVCAEEATCTFHVFPWLKEY